jgi:hypothetical protein
MTFHCADGEQPRLFAEIQRRNDTEIALDIRVLQIVEQPAALADEFEQPTTRVVVFLMCLKMLRQIRDSLTEQCDLDLRGSRVFFVQAVLVNDALFCADREWHETISFLLFAALYSGAHARVNVQSHHKADRRPGCKRNVRPWTLGWGLQEPVPARPVPVFASRSTSRMSRWTTSMSSPRRSRSAAPICSAIDTDRCRPPVQPMATVR